MTLQFKISVLKVIVITILVVFIPLLVFYLGIILPEYLACKDCNSEGAEGIDIWGNKIDCFGDNKAFGEVFFQLTSIIVGVFSSVIVIILFLMHHVKKSLK